MKCKTFYKYSLVAIGLFWVIYGYIFMKYHLPIRIWAVIDAPFNPFALSDFFSYDLLPTLAVMVTGASFVIYSSVLLTNVVKLPAKRFLYVILWLVIIAGYIRLLSIDVFPLLMYASRVQRHREILETLILYLSPLFTIYSGIILLKIVEFSGTPRMTNVKVPAATNRILLLLLAAFLWLSAGIVNLITKLREVGRTLYSWQMDGSLFDIVEGIISEFIAEPLFYILLGILLFAVWKWKQELGGQTTAHS